MLRRMMRVSVCHNDISSIPQKNECFFININFIPYDFQDDIIQRRANNFPCNQTKITFSNILQGFKSFLHKLNG